MPNLLFNIVQYSDKCMHGVVLHSIVLLRSLLYCIVNQLLGAYNTIHYFFPSGHGNEPYNLIGF